MIPEITKYPLDLTAEAISNRVDSEKHVVTDITNSLFPLKNGIFYKNKLLVKHIESGKLLKINEDFRLNYLHKEVTTRSGFGAYAIIVILKDNIKGELEVTYQTVGGQYAKLDDAILEAIQDINVSESYVYWNNIRYKPLAYPPEPHEHSADDIYGLGDLVESVDGVSSAIKGEHPDEIERLEELIGTKTSNINYMRLNQVNRKWDLTKDTPLRISARPFPAAILVSLDIWQDGQGYSGVEVAGELNSNGKWFNRSYMVTKGPVPDLEVQIMTIDGSTAEILVRATTGNDIDITPNVVKYLKHRPEVTSLSCLDMDTIGIPIPDEFEKPKPIWN